MSIKQMLADFANPGCRFRGAPFWAWNGKMEPKELRRQIRIMKKMGLGGFFMHSRVGLDTPYLDQEWFDCVKACIDEAGKQDMAAWLYDEDRWPSGAGGGIVTKDPRYRMRHLVTRRGRDISISGEKDILAVFKAELQGDTLLRYASIKPDGAEPELAEGEELLVFQVEIQAPSSWYNGQTYLDTLDREAVGRFIEVTHENYRKHVGHEFAKVVPGIFSDEPNYGRTTWTGGDNRLLMPWSRRLLEVFGQRYGYDLADFLPEVIYEGPGKDSLSRARYHYYDCLTHMFVDAFGRQIGEWCEANNLQFTGHLLEEDTLSRQVSVVGNCMRFYEHMQAPGMDLLTEHWRAYDTAKQVSSAAAQFGRQWRLSETYGCTGWDFPFLGHKALGDWQAALGINLRCQHLSWYTMQGQAKRDYPASIFHQSPWWRHYRKVEDYFARVFAAMTQGREVRDLLVIHPVESMWTMFSATAANKSGVAAYDEMLVTLCNSLLAAHLDFDYGDEELLSRHGRTGEQNGKPAFKVAQATYSAVLVPPLRTIRSTTVALLREFSRQGGLVIFMGEAPSHVDAEPSSQAAELAAACARTPAPSLPAGGELVSLLEPAARRISIRDGNGQAIPAALYLLREDEDAFYLFICNTGHDRDSLFSGSPLEKTRNDQMVRQRREEFPRVVVETTISGAPAPLQLDPESGAMCRAAAVKGDHGWQVKTSLPALGSRLFLFPKRETAEFERLPATPEPGETAGSDIAPERWDLSLTEDNVLVLDRPRMRVDGGEWQRPQEILRQDELLRDLLEVPRRGGRMAQPWVREKGKDAKTLRVELAYDFQVRSLPERPVDLAVECPHSFAIELNGHRVDLESLNGWWCDLSLRRIPLAPDWFRPGVNRLTLVAGQYGPSHPGLETIYLLGHFGVELANGLEPALTQAPSSLAIGDWVGQGLPFYSGSVIYRTGLRVPESMNGPFFIQIPSYNGVAARVMVNGQEAGIIAWPPNEVEITSLLRQGENSLAIEILGHRRNSHGPLHHAQKWPVWTGPAEFVSKGDMWREEYQLVPCGLTDPPRLFSRAGPAG